MAVFKVVTFFCLLASFTYSYEHKNHILYLMNAKEDEKAIEYYQKYFEKYNVHDFEILQNIAMTYLKWAAKSTHVEEKQLAMFGAGFATSAKSLNILENGLDAAELSIQLTALHFISALQDDKANNLLVKAMGSNFLETRFEAAFQLAQKKHPCALGQVLSLQNKLPIFFRPLFPQFFGLIGTPDAMRELRNYLFDSDPNVKVQAIYSLAQNHRDDFLPILRKKLSHSSIIEKEALCMALATLNDSISIDQIRKLTNATSENVRIAAHIALNRLNDKSYNINLLKIAAKGNLFALYNLKEINHSENILYKFLQSPDKQERLNASLALLKRRDIRCFEGLHEFFSNNFSHFCIQPQVTLGRGLECFKIMSYSRKSKRVDLDLSLQIKMGILKDTLDVDTGKFLNLAKYIFNNNHLDLIPYLTKLLISLNDKNSINLLKINAQRSGAPLIRNYSNLALFRLKEKGPYFVNIKKWLYDKCQDQLIELKSFESNKMKYEKSQYELSPMDSANFFLESLSALAENHNLESTLLILDILKKTKKVNKGPIAGILLRATE